VSDYYTYKRMVELRNKVVEDKSSPLSRDEALKILEITTMCDIGAQIGDLATTMGSLQDIAKALGELKDVSPAIAHLSTTISSKSF